MADRNTSPDYDPSDIDEIEDTIRTTMEEYDLEYVDTVLIDLPIDTAVSIQFATREVTKDELDDGEPLAAIAYSFTEGQFEVRKGEWNESMSKQDLGDLPTIARYDSVSRAADDAAAMLSGLSHTPSAPVARTDIYPYPSHAAINTDEYDHPEAVEDTIDLDAVLETLDTMYANDVTDETLLTEFGKRMANLMFHGGLTPSKAKTKTADELLPVEWSLQETADVLDMTKGALFSLQDDAEGATENAHHLYHMTFDIPMNLVLDETLVAEPPADYKTRYVLLEVVHPRTEGEEVYTHTRRRPDIQYRPPDPQYALLKETYTPSQYDPNESPETRSFSPFQEMEMKWYMNAAEVVDALYENRYFQTIDRATFWRDVLDVRGFETDSAPRDRLHPDVKMDEGT